MSTSAAETRYRSLATGFAFLIAFTGVIHEVVGQKIFPWAPAFFGTLLWNATGITLLVMGVLLIASILGAIDVPVTPLATATALGAAVALVFVAMRGEFHFFAVGVLISSIGAIIFNRKASLVHRRFGSLERL